MANEKWLTDEEVEAEIASLQDSPYVKLARKELRLKYKRRQRLYQLRNLEKRGKHLDAEGITEDTIEQMIMEEECETNEGA
ncbi:hypothetical protein [Bacillus infantis]|uniref:hypothetical protein n=1 Tax=Bacillus infantis TaxID=324767 RepID=UPI003CEF37BC